MKCQVIKNNKLDKVYTSVPGIGFITGRVLANELGDLQQFKNVRQLSSYIGMTPSEHSSGEHTRQGHITKQGKPIIRKLLVQSAWTAVRYDKELGATFGRIAAKAGSKRAIVAIARILIGRIRACFRTGKLYTSHELKIVERAPLKVNEQPKEKAKKKMVKAALLKIGEIGLLKERKRQGKESVA